MDSRTLNKILGVVVVVLVIAVGYLLMKSNDKDPVPAPVVEVPAVQEPVVVSPVATPAVEEVKISSEDWFSYDNTKYSFGFKYPQDWKLANCPGCVTADKQAASISYNSPSDIYGVFTVEVKPMTSCSSAKVCAEANRKVFSDDQETDGLKSYELGGESGYRESISRANSGGWKYEVYYFLKNKNLYMVSLQTSGEDEAKAMPLLSEILSTLTISTPGTVSLKTYSNAASKFSIGYPSDGHTVIGGPAGGIKITNVPESVGLKYEYKAGDYYIEVYVEDKPLDCSKQFASSRKITVDGVEGLRGPAKSELKNMYPYTLCFPDRDGKGYLVSVVEYDERQERPKSILDSFHFLD